MTGTILTVCLRDEQDIVVVRQRARQLGSLLGLDAQDQTRLATAASEIARNAHTYAGGGRVEFAVEGGTAPPMFLVRVRDQGPGIARLEEVLQGRYRSSTGCGLGIAGARRLVDRFDIQSSPAGTVVSLGKLLPSAAPLLSPTRLGRITAELAAEQLPGPLEELRQQNRELLRALEELRARQEELERLNADLQDTNRGVMVLYAELDEKADHLRRAAELKSRFLSNMSHEFRTPLNAIKALGHVLQQRLEGDLTAGQEKVVGYIRKAADDLSELVNDLLDLAKVEAGKVVIRPVRFEVAALLGALRGMLRPLLTTDTVTLTFEPVPDLPVLWTDEAKVSQILRNLISNALKFTERGEVRVSAVRDGDAIVFAVADTGIGIAPEDQERIFQEFGQLDHPIQRKVRGTGLGLPLSRRLAQLLGGTLTVESRPGVGSTFRARIPIRYVEPGGVAGAELSPPGGRAVPVLFVADRAEDLVLYESFLRDSGFQVISAATVDQARQVVRQVRPAAVVLDILLRGQDARELLAELKESPGTQAIPVLVLTTEDEREGLARGADAWAVKPLQRRSLLQRLRALTGHQPLRRILVVDDDEVSRYIVRGLLDEVPGVVIEAATGGDGLRRARDDHPDVIFLDLRLPDVDGHEVLARLKADPLTAGIPVVVVTSQVLAGGEHERLARHAAAIVSKSAPRALAVQTIHQTLIEAGLLEPGA